MKDNDTFSREEILVIRACKRPIGEHFMGFLRRACARRWMLPGLADEHAVSQALAQLVEKIGIMGTSHPISMFVADAGDSDSLAQRFGAGVFPPHWHGMLGSLIRSLRLSDLSTTGMTCPNRVRRLCATGPEDDTREAIVAFLKTLRPGDTVVETSGGMAGSKGVVINTERGLGVKWDHQFEEGNGLVTSLTGGTRLVPWVKPPTFKS